MPASGLILESIEIRGFKRLNHVQLNLSGLVVLIGENGVGKSTILEAFELLRSTTEDGFVDKLNRRHGGLRAMLTPGATSVEFILTVRAPEGPIRQVYTLELAFGAGDQVELRESLHHYFEALPPRVVFDRRGRSISIYDPNASHQQNVSSMIPADQAAFAAIGTVLADPVLGMRAVVANIEVHVPFEVTANWAAVAGHRTSAARAGNALVPTRRLELFAANLSAAYHELRNQLPAAWRETLDWLQLGLDVEDIGEYTEAAGGRIALKVKLRDLPDFVPVTALSDGQLAYLALVAMCRLGQPRSALVFDEPELHTHPKLVARIAQLLERTAEVDPVIVATQSDAFLDALSKPVEAVHVCALDRAGHLAIERVDADALKRWRERYGSIGHLRSEGLLDAVLVPSAEGSPTTRGTAPRVTFHPSP